MPQKFTSDKPTMAEIRQLKKPNRRSCFILLDSELAHRIREVEGEIHKLEVRAKQGRGTSSLADTHQKDLESLREQLEDLSERADESTVEFVFQDIGRKRYDELIRDNSPPDEQKKEYKDAGGEGVLTYNFDTFPPKLVSTCAIEPEISEQEATQIFDEWSEGDLEVLFTTAMLACKEPTSLPKSRAGTATTPDSEPNSTTALNGESPTPSS